MNNKNQKIKLLFRHRSMEMGGVEKVIISLLQHLNKDKFDITFCVNLYQGELRNEIPNHIHYVKLAKGKEDFSTNKIIQKIQLAARKLKLDFFQKFPSIIDVFYLKENYDIEIAPTYSMYQSVLNSANKKSKKIAWLHSDLTHPKLSHLCKNIIQQLHQFDYVIYGAKHTQNINENAFGYHLKNSAVVYNMIDIENVRNKATEQVFPTEFPTFSSVGRLHSRKGFHKLLIAHKRLLQKDLQHQIWIIGGGEEHENLSKQIKELGVEKTFILLGNQNNPYHYLASSNFFILPSESESYPLIIGEVMILGKPMIATNVGGINEMIEDNVNGILIDYNEESMENAMETFLTNPNLVQKFAQNNTTSHIKFDNQKIINQVETIFEDVFAQKSMKQRL